MPHDKDGYNALLNDMITSEAYSYAAPFLKSVRAQLKEKGSITEKQQKAIFNIYTKGAI